MAGLERIKMIDEQVAPWNLEPLQALPAIEQQQEDVQWDGTSMAGGMSSIDPSMVLESSNHTSDGGYRDDSMIVLSEDESELEAVLQHERKHQRASSHDSAGRAAEEERDKKRRAFKACSHCRQRKAKCDLGDLNNPHDPPCARCKREGIPCTFLPSRRGGRVPFAARKSKDQQQQTQQNQQGDAGTVSPERASSSKLPIPQPSAASASTSNTAASASAIPSQDPYAPLQLQENKQQQHRRPPSTSIGRPVVVPKRESSTPLISSAPLPSTNNTHTSNNNTDITGHRYSFSSANDINVQPPPADDLSIDPGLTSFDPLKAGGIQSAPLLPNTFFNFDSPGLLQPSSSASAIMSNQNQNQNQIQQHYQQQQVQQLQQSQSNQQHQQQQQQPVQQQRQYTSQNEERQRRQPSQQIPQLQSQHQSQQGNHHRPNQKQQQQLQQMSSSNPYQQSSRDGDQTYFTVPYHLSSISPPSTNWQQHQQHQQQRSQDNRNRRSDLDATLFNPPATNTSSASTSAPTTLLQQQQQQQNLNQLQMHQQAQQQAQQQALQQQQRSQGLRPSSSSSHIHSQLAPSTNNNANVGTNAGVSTTTPGSQTSGGGLSTSANLGGGGSGVGGGIGTGGTNPSTIVSPSGESHSSYDSAHRPRSKRHTEDNRIADPEILAAAKLRNPVDALDLLIQAADTRQGKSDGKGSIQSPENFDGAHHSHHHHHYGHGHGHHHDGGGGDSSMRGDVDRSTMTDRAYGEADSGSVSPTPFTLADFPLVKRGVISSIELIYFVNLFFAKIHHIFPIVPHPRIPTTEAALTAFARDELHLTTVFVLIASRLDQGGKRGYEIHDKSWEFMRELINDLVFGKDATVGAVEALLLLSENPPRQLAGSGSSSDDYAEENRMSWMIVGNAVRLGYMLALDQTTIYPVLPKAPDTPEGKAAIEKLDRERIAWTYCYIFDRQISIRTGKAFWSRGPGLCFTGSSADSFPSMRPIPGVQDDWASVIQAYVEITQTMTSAHDILYPSRDRTIALVRVGEYYKYIDEFTRTLNAFRFTWEGKKWDTFPLTECVWITFHYLRLYIYAFAFQAHVQRATDANEDAANPVPSSTMFPRGPMGSPDAKFILEAIDAAADLLRICTDRLHPQGVLQFLPWRYFLYFAYAGVFLLKAVFIKAVAPLDRRTIVRLLKRLIVCLACSSKDEHHHAVRYARLLNSLLKTFSRGRDGVGTAAPTPSRPSPEPSPLPQIPNGEEWPLSRATSPQAQAAPTPNIRTQFFTTNTPSSNLTFANNNPLSGLEAINSNFLGGQGPSLAASHLLSDSFPPNTAQEEATAADLLSDFNLDFGFPSEQTAPFDAYSNLLDDTTMNFWAALSNSQGEWPNYGGSVQP